MTETEIYYEVAWDGRGSFPWAEDWPMQKRNPALSQGYNPNELPTQSEMRGKCLVDKPWSKAHHRKQRSRRGIRTKKEAIQ